MYTCLHSSVIEQIKDNDDDDDDDDYVGFLQGRCSGPAGRDARGKTVQDPVQLPGSRSRLSDARKIRQATGPEVCNGAESVYFLLFRFALARLRLLNVYDFSVLNAIRRKNSFSALTLLVGRQEGHPACKKTE